MRITVCIGSSCHIKGSRQVIDGFRRLINKYNLDDKVELTGTFCMGKCQKGVCVTVDDEVCSVSHDTVEEFFEKNVLARMEVMR